MSDISPTDETIRQLLARIRALIIKLCPEAATDEDLLLEKIGEFTEKGLLKILEAPAEGDVPREDMSE